MRCEKKSLHFYQGFRNRCHFVIWTMLQGVSKKCIHFREIYCTIHFESRVMGGMSGVNILQIRGGYYAKRPNFGPPHPKKTKQSHFRILPPPPPPPGVYILVVVLFVGPHTLKKTKNFYCFFGRFRWFLNFFFEKVSLCCFLAHTPLCGPPTKIYTSG